MTAQVRTSVYVLVAQSCPTLGDPMDCSPPGFSIHVILQARIAMPSSRGSYQPRDLTQVSCIAGRSFTIWATMLYCEEALDDIIFLKDIIILASS